MKKLSIFNDLTIFGGGGYNGPQLLGKEAAL